MAARTTFEKDGLDRTVLGIAANIPSLDESNASHLSAMM
jgi:hypothetical protein